MFHSTLVFGVVISKRNIISSFYYWSFKKTEGPPIEKNEWHLPSYKSFHQGYFNVFVWRLVLGGLLFSLISLESLKFICHDCCNVFIKLVFVKNISPLLIVLVLCIFTLIFLAYVLVLSNSSLFSLRTDIYLTKKSLKVSVFTPFMPILKSHWMILTFLFPFSLCLFSAKCTRIFVSLCLESWYSFHYIHGRSSWDCINYHFLE